MKARLELSEPRLADNLIGFLRRRKLEAEHSAAVIDIELPYLEQEQARLELDLLLRVWQSLHSDVSIEIVP